MNQSLSRRRFLKVSALAAGAAAWPGPSILRAAAAPKLNIAMIGVGGQGLSRLKEALQCGANIVALCDADEKMIAVARQATAATLGNPNSYVDFRKMLESEKSLDGVIIATPDHWHAPVCQAAFAAGRHIFCEKPLARAISEVRDLRGRAGGSQRLRRDNLSTITAQGFQSAGRELDAGKREDKAILGFRVHAKRIAVHE